MTFWYPKFWSDIYHESIVVHDHRLLSIGTPWTSFDEIIDVDWLAGRNCDRIVSHPIVIYLNKLAPKSQKVQRINKDVIYKRPKPVNFPFDIDTGQFRVSSSKYLAGLREYTGLKACSLMTINHRRRWFILYERNPRSRFASAISALSTQLNRAIQCRSRFTKDEPAETIARSIVIPMDKYLKRYKVRIYHRQAWNLIKEGASFPSIWKEPDPSALVDDVSGIALRHITLLCRDVISECNKCTVGCPSGGKLEECDACRLESHKYDFHREIPVPIYSGSFAEGCMLPTFFVWNESNEPKRKLSDFDNMYDAGGLVGFNAKSNTFATIELGNCKPGFFRLRVAKNGELLRFSKNTDFRKPIPMNVKTYKKTFNHGPGDNLESLNDQT